MLGTFSLGLAHELRNPLGAIKGLSQLLMLERNLPSSTGAYLERMTREVDRVDRVVRELLDLSTQPVGQPEPTDVALMLTEARELARIGVDTEKLAGVEIKCSMAPMPSLLLQGDRMVQAIAKIINNAYHACAPGEKIWIDTLWMEHPSGAACEIHIRNNGAVINPENEGKIFEPFFTTRERATGLGLTIANQIVVQNEGKLELCNSTLGTDFMIRFFPARTADTAARVEEIQKGAEPCQ
jgi:signal transduction histidine kinase